MPNKNCSGHENIDQYKNTNLADFKNNLTPIRPSPNDQLIYKNKTWALN